MRNDLHRLAAATPPEGRPQIGVSVQQRLGRGAEAAGVHRAFEFEDQLYQVHVGGVPFVLVQGVEEQTLLERGHGEYVGRRGLPRRGLRHVVSSRCLVRLVRVVHWFT